LWEVVRGLASFGDHLIEPAVEPRQRLGDAIGRTRIGGWHIRARRRRCCKCGGVLGSGRRRGLREASLSHALELPRQVVETVMHRREVIAVLVIVVVSIWSASLPHAFLQPFGWSTRKPGQSLGKPVRLRKEVTRCGPRNLRQTLVYQGKQTVNPLVRRAIFLTNNKPPMCITGVIRQRCYPGL